MTVQEFGVLIGYITLAVVGVGLTITIVCFGISVVIDSLKRKEDSDYFERH